MIGGYDSWRLDHPREYDRDARYDDDQDDDQDDDDSDSEPEETEDDSEFQPEPSWLPTPETNPLPPNPMRVLFTEPKD